MGCGLFISAAWQKIKPFPPASPFSPFFLWRLHEGMFLSFGTSRKHQPFPRMQTQQKQWLCHGMRLFHLYCTVKIQPFPLSRVVILHVIIWNGPVIILCGCFISTACWKYGFFIRFFHWRNPRLTYFVGYPFGTSKRKVSTISYDTAFQERRAAMRGYVFWGDSACSRYAHAWFA